MFKELLPIGTVVTLRGGIRKIMIIGVKIAQQDKPDVVYDYVGVLYPEGFLGDEGNFMFNQSDINDVIFKGYNNPEREDMLDYLEKSCEKEDLQKGETFGQDGEQATAN